MKSTDYQEDSTVIVEAIRQGTEECDVCHGQGVLHGGEIDVTWRSAQRKVSKSGKVKRGYKRIGRPALEGETCPKCFGCRFGTNVIDQEEADRYRQATNQELLVYGDRKDRVLHRQQQIRSNVTYDEYGRPMDARPDLQQLTDGVRVREDDDGTVEFVFE